MTKGQTPIRALVATAADNLGLSVIRGLADAGIEAVALAERQCWSTRLSRHCSRFIGVDRGFFSRASEAAALIRDVCRREAASLIIPADVPASLLVARIKAELEGLDVFPVGRKEDIELFDDKWTFYQFLTKHGLSTPRTVRIEHADEVPPDFRFPAFAKPSRDSGGRGVKKVDDPHALADWIANSGARPPLLVQEFVPGRDVDLSVLCDRGELVTWAVQTRDGAGSVIFLKHDGVLELGRKTVKTLGYTGLAHFDMRDDGGGGGVRMIECNPRFWGTFQYAVSLGADFLAKGIEMAAGGEPRRSQSDPVGVCPSVRSLARSAARRGFSSLPPASAKYLKQKLADPLPELSRTIQRLLGIDAGP